MEDIESPEALDERERELRPQLTRAARAQQILDDELVVSAFKDIEDDIMTFWRDAETPEDREDAHVRLKVLGVFKQRLQAHMRKGDVAMKEMEEIKQKRSWWRRTG